MADASEPLLGEDNEAKTVLDAVRGGRTNAGTQNRVDRGVSMNMALHVRPMTIDDLPTRRELYTQVYTFLEQLLPTVRAYARRFCVWAGWPWVWYTGAVLGEAWVERVARLVW